MLFCVQRFHQGNGAKQQGRNGDHEDKLGEAAGGGAIQKLQARKEITQDNEQRGIRRWSWQGEAPHISRYLISIGNDHGDRTSL